MSAQLDDECIGSDNRELREAQERLARARVLSGQLASEDSSHIQDADLAELRATLEAAGLHGRVSGSSSVEQVDELLAELAVLEHVGLASERAERDAHLAAQAELESMWQCWRAAELDGSADAWDQAISIAQQALERIADLAGTGSGLHRSGMSVLEQMLLARVLAQT